MKIKLLSLLTISVILTSCWEEPQVKTFVRPVKLAAVQSLNAYDKDFVGVVSAEQYTNLAFLVQGQITKIFINEGSFVKKGQLLAEVDPADMLLKLEADKAKYQSTKSILERNERLLEKEAISVQDVEIARANYLQAKSAYDYSMNQLSYAKLHAPFSGSVEKKFVETYQKVQAGEKIFKIINPDVLEVNFTLPETDANIVYAKSKYFIEFENFRGDLFAADIKEVVDASVDGAGIPVTLKITDSRFKPEKYNIKAGFACRVRVQIDNPAQIQQYMTVPVSAVFAETTDANGKYVWVYDQAASTVVKRAVVVDGLMGANQVIVTSGVSSGDKVVVAGVYQLVDNQKVTVLNN